MPHFVLSTGDSIIPVKASRKLIILGIIIEQENFHDFKAQLHVKTSFFFSYRLNFLWVSVVVLLINLVIIVRQKINGNESAKGGKSTIWSAKYMLTQNVQVSAFHEQVIWHHFPELIFKIQTFLTVTSIWRPSHTLIEPCRFCIRKKAVSFICYS